LRGYVGRVLHVDLTRRKYSIERFDESFAKKWLGATGFGIKLLIDSHEPGNDLIVIAPLYIGGG